MLKIHLTTELEQMALGVRLAALLPQPSVVYLQGDLGAGKTTLVRGLLNGFGEAVRVKSPTYTLIEPYQLNGADFYHMDLYRLADPEELEYLGIRDLPETAILLVEWPARGAGMLPPPDLAITIAHQDVGRLLTLAPMSEVGCNIVDKLQ